MTRRQVSTLTGCFQPVQREPEPVVGNPNVSTLTGCFQPVQRASFGSQFLFIDVNVSTLTGCFQPVQRVGHRRSESRERVSTLTGCFQPVQRYQVG